MHSAAADTSSPARYGPHGMIRIMTLWYGRRAAQRQPQALIAYGARSNTKRKASPMADMRLAKREVREASELRAIVDNCQTVRIGAVDEEGMFIVPMSFGYDWELDESGTPRLTLWLHSAGEGRKAAAFGANGSAGIDVAIEMDCEDGVITGPYACSYSFAYRSIMGTGRIYPIASGEDKVYGLTRIMEHMAPGAPQALGPGVLDRTAVWRIDVARFTGKQRQPKA